MNASLKTVVLGLVEKVERELSNDVCCEDHGCGNGGCAYEVISEEDGTGWVAQQIRVLRQLHSGACGHHALYNAVCALRACRGRVCDADNSWREWQRIRCAALFWRHFLASVGLLRAEAITRGDRHYPWRTKDALCGILERSHLRFLLRESRGSAAILRGCDGAGDFTELPDMCQASLENGTLDLTAAKRVDAVLGSLDGCHAFVIGVLGHWTTVVVARSQGHPVRLLLMDSRNKPILGSVDHSAVVRAHFDELAARGKRFANRARSEATFVQELIGFRNAARLLGSCACRQVTMEAVCIVSPLRATLLSYMSRVVERGEEVAHWLSEFPIPVLRSTFLAQPLGRYSIDAGTRQAALLWSTHIVSHAPSDLSLALQLRSIAKELRLQIEQ